MKILISGDKGKENVINALTNDFYSLIPHNFGVKIPPKIDHLLRIKDKIKALETISAI
jgi:Poly(ADP-ribose) polymerase, regulatory domain